MNRYDYIGNNKQNQAKHDWNKEPFRDLVGLNTQKQHVNAQVKGFVLFQIPLIRQNMLKMSDSAATAMALLLGSTPA